MAAVEDLILDSRTDAADLVAEADGVLDGMR